MTQSTPLKKSSRLTKGNKENENPYREVKRTPKRSSNNKDYSDCSPPKRLCDEDDMRAARGSAKKQLSFSNAKNKTVVSPLRLIKVDKNSKTYKTSKSSRSVDDEITVQLNANDEVYSNETTETIVSPFKSLAICIEKCDHILKSPQATKLTKKLVDTFDNKIKKLAKATTNPPSEDKGKISISSS